MTEPTFALALSSGGARGAYEAGALLYLAERGLRFGAVAGASVGSLNGAFYVQGDGSPAHMKALGERWRTLPDAGVVQVDASKVVAVLASLASKELPFLARAIDALGVCKGGLLAPQPMEKLLDSWIDYDAVLASSSELIVAALEESEPLVDIATYAWRKATYFRASECDRNSLRALLLASAAIPFAFPSRELGGRRYADAGLVDPLPAAELFRSGHRRIVSVFLSDSTIQNREDFPGAIVMQLRPSENIDTGMLSCFDFSRESIERLLAMGYADGELCFREAEEIFSRIVKLKELGRTEEALAQALPDRRRPR